MKTKEDQALLEEKQEHNNKLSYLSAILPSLVLLLTAILLICVLTGFSYEKLKNLDLTTILIISSLVGISFAALYYRKKLHLARKKMIRASFKGISGMYEAIGILFFAWLLGSITTTLNTAGLVSGIVDNFNYSLLYVLSFLLASGLSFMTSSWATFGIVIPVLVPLCITLNGNPAVILAAIVAGGVFGDHNSPISSTTIITKAASKIRIMEHFHTQLPYSLIAFLISIYLFFLIGRV
jgi:tetracycline resistance efflux pump